MTDAVLYNTLRCNHTSSKDDCICNTVIIPNNVEQLLNMTIYGIRIPTQNHSTLLKIRISLPLTWDGLEPLHALADLDLDGGGRGRGGLQPAHGVGQVRAVTVRGAGRPGQLRLQRAAVRKERWSKR